MRESEREKEKRGKRKEANRARERERWREKSIFSCPVTHSNCVYNSIERKKHYDLVNNLYYNNNKINKVIIYPSKDRSKKTEGTNESDN